MNKHVLVPIADGIEEIEAVVIIDVLRRAGAEVVVASIKDLTVRASRGVNLVADTTLESCINSSFDLIALPGGMPGAEHLRDSLALRQMLTLQHENKRLIGAICASPAIVLHHHGILKDHLATCYPSFQNQLDRVEVDLPVVVDGHIITSQGPGTAFAFALSLVEQLWGENMKNEVADSMVLPH